YPLPPHAHLTVTMTDGKVIAWPGTTIPFIFTVTNTAPTSALSLHDALPISAALLNPNFAPSAGAYDTNTRIWSGLSLASGQSVSMTLTGTIASNATGSLTNTVTVAAPSGTTDTNPANNAATDTDTTPSVPPALPLS